MICSSGEGGHLLCLTKGEAVMAWRYRLRSKSRLQRSRWSRCWQSVWFELAHSRRTRKRVYYYHDYDTHINSKYVVCIFPQNGSTARRNIPLWFFCLTHLYLILYKLTAYEVLTVKLWRVLWPVITVLTVWAL